MFTKLVWKPGLLTSSNSKTAATTTDDDIDDGDDDTIIHNILLAFIDSLRDPDLVQRNLFNTCGKLLK